MGSLPNPATSGQASLRTSTAVAPADALAVGGDHRPEVEGDGCGERGADDEDREGRAEAVGGHAARLEGDGHRDDEQDDLRAEAGER